ncbi:MAG TPA: META domain-containing protein [Kiritimatiellia bacterium]|nr:META domain-containing protein [Kiritimatiellia bacterium]HRZ13211.1 META domain-containing protein [Kiritimatiellia bacterium]HSA19729.1 META domain-containing protein [Kiritimatiellia bacterium]
MKRHTINPVAWMLGLALLAAGCEDEVPEAMHICRTEWILKSLGPVGAETPIIANSRVELRFACDDTFSGNSGCNSYSGQFSATDAGDITIGQTAMTEMACLDAALMDQEARYIGALTRVTRFEREDDTLRLYYNGGAEDLYFEVCTDCD